MVDDFSDYQEKEILLKQLAQNCERYAKNRSETIKDFR